MVKYRKEVNAMSYTNTFIQVSLDCPATSSIVPVSKRDKKTAHEIQYELLSQNPYKFNHEDLIYEVHIRHKAISEEELINHATEIRDQLFQKSHPCLRASMLPKKFGWGVHYDQDGRIAIYGMESNEYRQFVTEDRNVKLLFAMRNSRK